jgi:RNA polymerase sigma-70 factor (ECF subfamily)
MTTPTDKTERAGEFISLFTQHSRPVYGYIRALVHHQSDAEDIFQEASRVMWQKFDQYQSDSDFLAWACCISHYEVLMYRRSKARQKCVLSDDVYALLDKEMPDFVVNSDLRSQSLSHCIELLPASDRELLRARYSPGATTRLVSETMKRSVDAVYRSLRRIHEALFNCIQRRLAEEGNP